MGILLKFHFQHADLTIPERLSRRIKQGITVFIIVRNEKGAVTFGLPVTDKDEKIVSYNTKDEAFDGAKKFLGF